MHSGQHLIFEIKFISIPFSRPCIVSFICWIGTIWRLIVVKMPTVIGHNCSYFLSFKIQINKLVHIRVTVVIYDFTLGEQKEEILVGVTN